MKLKRSYTRIWCAMVLVIMVDVALSFFLPAGVMPVCLLVLFGGFAAIFWCDKKLRCPHCGEHLGVLPPMGKKVYRKCVRCGRFLVFDDQPEPRDPARQPDQADKP